jgi:hypothetical protein
MGMQAEKAKRLKDFQGYQVTEELCREGEAQPHWKFMHCLPRVGDEVDDEVRRFLVIRHAHKANGFLSHGRYSMGHGHLSSQSRITGSGRSCLCSSSYSPDLLNFLRADGGGVACCLENGILRSMTCGRKQSLEVGTAVMQVVARYWDMLALSVCLPKRGSPLSSNVSQCCAVSWHTAKCRQPRPCMGREYNYTTKCSYK